MFVVFLIRAYFCEANKRKRSKEKYHTFGMTYSVTKGLFVIWYSICIYTEKYVAGSESMKLSRLFPTESCDFR